MPGYRYSAALQAQHLTWSDQTLDAWLSGPRQFIPGAAMPFRVSVAAERADPDCLSTLFGVWIVTTDIGRATPTAVGSADRAANPRGQETGSGASRRATRRGLGSRAFNVCTKRFTEL